MCVTQYWQYNRDYRVVEVEWSATVRNVLGAGTVFSPHLDIRRHGEERFYLHTYSTV